MKLLSFAADGKELFGVVSGDGIVTLNDKTGQPDLRSALAAGAMAAMHKAAKEGKPDRKLGEIKFLPAIPRPAKNSLRRNQLPLACRRNRARIAETAEHVHPLHRHAGRP